MKNQMKRAFSFVLALAISLTLTIPALATESFTDVNQGDWFYNSVMDIANRGLMVGRDNGKFDPEANMTVMEFLAVCTRALYSDDLARQPSNSGEWWVGNYMVALDKGLGLVLKIEMHSAISTKWQ